MKKKTQKKKKKKAVFYPFFGAIKGEVIVLVLSLGGCGFFVSGLKTRVEYSNSDSLQGQGFGCTKWKRERYCCL